MCQRHKTASPSSAPHSAAHERCQRQQADRLQAVRCCDYGVAARVVRWYFVVPDDGTDSGLVVVVRCCQTWTSIRHGDDDSCVGVSSSSDGALREFTSWLPPGTSNSRLRHLQQRPALRCQRPPSARRVNLRRRSVFFFFWNCP